MPEVKTLTLLRPGDVVPLRLLETEGGLDVGTRIIDDVEFRI